MNACLQSIVTISDPCATTPTVSKSGFDLMDAPELTAGSLADIASSEYIQGMELARRKLEQAIVQVKNDFTAALHEHNVVTAVTQPELETTASFNPGVVHFASSDERGLLLARSTTIRGKLRKLHIRRVQVYPLGSAPSAAIRIYDAGRMYGYNVELVAGQLNTFNIQHTVQGKDVRIVLHAPTVAVAGAYLNCGCDGSLPAGTGTITGLNGATTVRREGFGINATFQYACDYDQLLCDLSNTYVGELIWLKARVLLLDEHLRTDRLNNWIIYNREDTQKFRAEVDAQYREKWNMLMGGLYDILKNYRDDCITCRGPRWVVNQ